MIAPSWPILWMGVDKQNVYARYKGIIFLLISKDFLATENYLISRLLKIVRQRHRIHIQNLIQIAALIVLTNYTFITVKIKWKPKHRRDIKGVLSCCGGGGSGEWRYFFKVGPQLMLCLSTVQSSDVSILLYMIFWTIFKSYILKQNPCLNFNINFVTRFSGILVTWIDFGDPLEIII